MRHALRCAMALICLTGLFKAGLVQAEEGSTAQEARLSVRTLAVEECAMPEWYLAADGESYSALKWPVSQPSPTVVAVAGPELQLFLKEADAQGVAQYKVARKLAIPAGVSEVLLVAWPVDGDEKFGLMVVADGFKTAKASDWLVINTCGQEVTLRYGAEGEPLRLQPTEAKPFTVEPQSDKGSAVTAQVMVKEEPKTIYSTYWAAPGKQRSLVLFYEKEARVKLRRIVDPLMEAAPDR